MPHWDLITLPAKDGEALTGIKAPEDRRQSLSILVGMIARAEAKAREVQREFDAEIANAKRQGGQQDLIDEALALLVDRRRIA